jgi:hypothetical protein
MAAPRALYVEINDYAVAWLRNLISRGLIADGRKVQVTLKDVAHLASWVTPSARDHKDTAGMATTGINPDGSTREHVDPLPRQAMHLTSWPTPMAGTPAQHGYNEAGSTDSSRQTTFLCGKDIQGSGITALPNWQGPARLTASGHLAIGYFAETASGDQLNPEHSRWLMGCPVQWAQAAPNYDDWQAWQGLMESLSPEQKRTALVRSAATATP